MYMCVCVLPSNYQFEMDWKWFPSAIFWSFPLNHWNTWSKPFFLPPLNGLEEEKFRGEWFWVFYFQWTNYSHCRDRCSMSKECYQNTHHTTLPFRPSIINQEVKTFRLPIPKDIYFTNFLHKFYFSSHHHFGSL